MAGGGISSINSNTAVATRYDPYLVAYWGYFDANSSMVDLNSQSVKVSLAGDSLFNAQEVWICNHPWPYWGNIYGDGFARPLNQAGDRFGLIIHGVKASGQEVKTDSIDLAINYDVGFPPEQDDTWEKFIFPSSFVDIQYLYFTMYSTDNSGEWGPNTAVYFCMDKLKVTKTGGVATASATVQKSRTATQPKAMEVTDYFPKASYTGGDVTVYNANGTQVLKTTVKAGEKVNLSKLPAGNYHLRHGSKTIPIIKK